MGNTNSKRAEDSRVSSFTCQICIETMPSNKKFTNNDLCAHPFCTDCVIKYIQIRVAEDRIADIRCPAEDCDRSFDPLWCRAAVPPQLFDEWCDVLCEKAILGFVRCYCPNRDCSALVVNECGGNVKRSECPNCKRLFCFQCKVPWHAGYQCEESGDWRDRNDIEFGVLAERKKWMRCPQCDHCVERIAGCSTVNCRCGIFFCYKCGRKLLLPLYLCDCNRTRWCIRVGFYVFFIVIIILLFFWDLFYNPSVNDCPGDNC